MTDPSKDITPAILLQHMQGMEKRLNERFDKRFDTVDNRLNEVDVRLARLESNVNLLFTQTKNLTDELDTVEVIQLPKMRKSIRNLSKKFSDHIALPAHQSALKVS